MGKEFPEKSCLNKLQCFIYFIAVHANGWWLPSFSDKPPRPPASLIPTYIKLSRSRRHQQCRSNVLFDEILTHYPSLSGCIYGNNFSLVSPYSSPSSRGLQQSSCLMVQTRNSESKTSFQWRTIYDLDIFSDVELSGSLLCVIFQCLYNVMCFFLTSRSTLTKLLPIPRAKLPKVLNKEGSTAMQFRRVSLPRGE
jgi:hypothetical protein